MTKLFRHLKSLIRVFLLAIFFKDKVKISSFKNTYFDVGVRIIFSGTKPKLEIGSVYLREYVKLNINGGKLIIGKNVFINSFSSINCQEKIVVGDNCLFGEGVRLYDHDHIFTLDGNLTRRAGFKARPIEIGDNVWLGSNCIILKGVKIGDNSVVGANTVITKDIPKNTVTHNANELITRTKQ